MASLSRKQREVLQREELILQKARGLLLDLGYHGLTMDRVAESIEYSKGTVYQHFGCKEEVLTELAVRIFQKRNELFARSAAFCGRTRERMVALGEAAELFVRLYPDDMRLLPVLRAEVISSKTTASRREKLRRLDLEVFYVILDIVREAMDKGDLVLSPDTAPEELPFGLWSLTDGGYATILRKVPFMDINIADPYACVIKSCEILGDGYGWKPLSTEWDYQATRKRVREEIFGAEFAILASRGRNLELRKSGSE